MNAARRPGRCRRRSAAVAGLVALVLAGCGPVTSSSASTAADQAFLGVVHVDDPNVNHLRTDVQLLRLGSAACSEFSAGVSFFDLADTLQNQDRGLPSTDLGAVISAAAEHLCPQYRDRVR